VPPKQVQNNKIPDAPFKSCFQSASDLNNDKSSLNEKLQVASAKQSHVLDDIQSERSEELIEIGDQESEESLEDFKSQPGEDEEESKEKEAILSSEKTKNDHDNSSDEDSSSEDKEVLTMQSLRALIRKEVDKNFKRLTGFDAKEIEEYSNLEKIDNKVEAKEEI